MTASTTTAAGSELALAASARTIQLTIRAQLLRDVARLWPLLDVRRLDDTFPGWLSAMRALVTSYHGQSATAASAFYRAARAAATQSPAPSSLIALAGAPNADWLTKAFGYSGPGLIRLDTARPGTALSTTLGTAARVALEGGRSTILETVKTDPVAVGYYRVTDGQPCAFCALLAARVATKGRGQLYKTEESASFQAHNDCGCTAAPFFRHDQELPKINQKAAEVYRNRGKGNALVAFRKSWAEHLAAANPAA